MLIIIPAMTVLIYWVVTSTKKGSIIKMKQFKSSRSLKQVQLDHAKKLAENENLEEIDVKNQVNRAYGLDYYFFEDDEISSS